MYKRVIYAIIFLNIMNANNLEKISVQLLWKHQFEFAGFYMAKEKGFYNDIGIDVYLKEFQSGTNITKEIIEQKSNFGVNGSNLILDKINGLDIYMLMPFLQVSPLVIATKKRTDLNNIVNLRNKKIMLADNQMMIPSLKAMFKINNLTENDFETVPHNFNIQNLLDDKVDAISIYLSNELYHLTKGNYDYIIYNPSDYGFDFYDDILFTSEKFANSNPTLVKNFYEATKKGWDYAFSNIEETANLINMKYNTQNKSLEQLLYEGKKLKELAFFDKEEYLKFKIEVINQIIQTYKLLNLVKISVNIDKFIYTDAIYNEEEIETRSLYKILGCILLFLCVFYYWIRKLADVKIRKKQESISLLLDNIGQGCLTFESDFRINNEYSKECERLLGEYLYGKDIRTLLFNNSAKQQFFTETLIAALHENVQIKRNSYLSLLPEIISFNNKAIKLEYKIINRITFMIILTNVTTQKKLENKMKKEEETFKMIVAITSECASFYDILIEYEEFIKNKENITDIHKLYRLIHTFKGNFSQFYIKDIVDTLHLFENILIKIIKSELKDIKSLNEIYQNYDFQTSFNYTKEMITRILGKEFLEMQNYITINLSNIADLQCKISNAITKRELIISEHNELLERIENLSKQNLYYMLTTFNCLIKSLAGQLHKDIGKLNIIGDKEFLIKYELKPFIKSLVHIFRNSIDHGIESPEDRIKKGKKESGIINCEFKEINNLLHIIISDDGAGLDIAKIKEQAIIKGIDITCAEEEIIKIIFNNEFTTKIIPTDISGRGVGLNIVKSELDKLNGRVIITSSKDNGTIFEFIIPL